MDTADAIQSALFQGPGYLLLRRPAGMDPTAALVNFRRSLDGLGDNVSRHPTGRSVGEWVVQARADPTFANRYRGQFHSTKELPFHCDGSGEDDRTVRILGMFCERQAPHGGETWLADSFPVVEDISEQERSLLEESWPRLHPYRRHPPFAFKPILRPGREFDFGSYRLREGLQALADPHERQKRAGLIDRLDAGLQRRMVRLRLEQGDGIVINNLRIVHGRSGYLDNPSKPRRLVRIWIGSWSPPQP